MKRILTALVLSLFVNATGASGGTIIVDFTGTVDSSLEDSATFWPIGTSVAGSVSFKAFDTVFDGFVFGGTGSIDWSIGASDYSLTLTGPVAVVGTAPETIVISLAATEPSFPSINVVALRFHVGPYALSSELPDLLTAGSVTGVGFGAHIPSGYYLASSLISRDLTAEINPVAVPEPATLTTLGFGLIGVAWLGRRRLRRAAARS